jgi:outer membrane protein TolC
VRIVDDSTLATPDSLTLDQLTAYALAHREELQQADGGVHIAQAQQRIATSGVLPMVAVSASYGVQGNAYKFDRNNDVALANFVLSWNLFNGGQDHARREQATFLRDEATYRRRDAERGVRVQVANAFDAVAIARAALGSANDRYESAQRAFVLVQRRFAEGLAAPIDFLSARAAFTAAALNQVITRYTLAARAVELERAAALRSLPQ